MTTAAGPNRRETHHSISEPMSFTGSEFFRGVLFAVLVFTLTFPFATLPPGTVEMLQAEPAPQLDVLFLTLLLTTGYTGLFASVFCTLIGAPLAYSLGRILRHQQNRWLHRLSFVILGLLSGILGCALVELPFFDLRGLPMTLVVPAALLAAFSAWSGWEFTRARTRRETTFPRSSRPTPDEDAEDQMVDDALRRTADGTQGS